MLIIGHSFTQSLSIALTSSNIKSCCTTPDKVESVFTSGREITPPVILMLRGAETLLSSFYYAKESPEHYDFIPHPLLIAYLESFFARSTSYHGKSLEEELDEVKRIIKKYMDEAPLYFLAPPPPQNLELVLKHIDIYNTPQDFRVLPIQTCQKLWLVVSEILEKICSSVGVNFIPCPKPTIDAQGLLREEYWCDGYHANANYGFALIKQLKSLNIYPRSKYALCSKRGLCILGKNHQ